MKGATRAWAACCTIRDHQTLRAPLEHRDVLQDGKVVLESGRGVPESILRCSGRPCHPGLLPLHYSGTGQEDQRRSPETRQLVHAVCDELRQTGFTEALALLLRLLEETFSCVIDLCKEQVQRLIERLIETLPRNFRELLLFLAPEYS